MRCSPVALPLLGLAIAMTIGGPGVSQEATSASGVPGVLPADVRAYIDRRHGCNHWQGEDAYDAERRRDIDAAIKALACHRLARDEARLRRRHAHSPRVLKAMDAAHFEEG